LLDGRVLSSAGLLPQVRLRMLPEMPGGLVARVTH
jgi:hypothetical protein